MAPDLKSILSPRKRAKSLNGMDKIRASAAAQTRATRTFNVTDGDRTIVLRSGTTLSVRPPPSNRVGEIYESKSTGENIPQPTSTEASRSLALRPKTLAKTPTMRLTRATATIILQAKKGPEAKADVNGRVKKPAAKKPTTRQTTAQLKRAEKRGAAFERGVKQREKERMQKALAEEPVATGRLRRRKSQLTIIAVEDRDDRLEKRDGAWEREAEKRIREQKGDGFELAGISGAARDVRKGKVGKFTIGMKMVDVSDSEEDLDMDGETPVSYGYERMIL